MGWFSRNNDEPTQQFGAPTTFGAMGGAGYGMQNGMMDPMQMQMMGRISRGGRFFAAFASRGDDTRRTSAPIPPSSPPVTPSTSSTISNVGRGSPMAFICSAASSR